MRTLRVLIVDDEPIARSSLRQELMALEGVEVVGEASNGDSALAGISELLPDLVFLDIQMPGMTGFEMLGRLGSGHFPLIAMVTAFDNQAINAFDAGAVDYLLKPISPQRLQQSVERAARLYRHPKVIAQQISHLQRSAPLQNPRIVGRSGHEYFLVSPNEILAFQANGDIITIIATGQTYLATQSLKSLQERLVGTSFQRIHRNALVNLDHAHKISMITSQRWLLTLNNGLQFVVSKRQARCVRKVLDW